MQTDVTAIETRKRLPINDGRRSGPQLTIVDNFAIVTHCDLVRVMITLHLKWSKLLKAIELLSVSFEI